MTKKRSWVGVFFPNDVRETKCVISEIGYIQCLRVTSLHVPNLPQRREVGRSPTEDVLNHTFYIAWCSKVPTARVYQNEMQLRARSSERSCLFGAPKAFTSHREKVCSVSALTWLDRCVLSLLPKDTRRSATFRRKCYLVSKWDSLYILPPGSPCDVSIHITGYTGELFICYSLPLTP